MPSAGFELVIPAIKRLQTHTLDRTDTIIALIVLMMWAIPRFSSIYFAVAGLQ
jgi:hypothetical protein